METNCEPHHNTTPDSDAKIAPMPTQTCVTPPAQISSISEVEFLRTQPVKKTRKVRAKRAGPSLPDGAQGQGVIQFPEPVPATGRKVGGFPILESHGPTVPSNWPTPGPLCDVSFRAVRDAILAGDQQRVMFTGPVQGHPATCLTPLPGPACPGMRSGDMRSASWDSAMTGSNHHCCLGPRPTGPPQPAVAASPWTNSLACKHGFLISDEGRHATFPASVGVPGHGPPAMSPTRAVSECTSASTVQVPVPAVEHPRGHYSALLTDVAQTCLAVFPAEAVAAQHNVSVGLVREILTGFMRVCFNQFTPDMFGGRPNPGKRSFDRGPGSEDTASQCQTEGDAQHAKRPFVHHR